MSGGLPGLILCAWDMRPCSDRGLLVADALARRLSARLALVHVISEASPAHGAFPGLAQRGTEGLPASMRLAADEAAERVSRLTSRPIDSLPVWVGEGSPGSLILAAQERLAADLVVVAACGDDDPAGPLGTVALEVLRNSPRPALAVRAMEREGPVLVASDLSDPAYPAIVAGAVLAKGLGAALSVLHVVEPSRADPLGRGATPSGERGDSAIIGIERHASARDVLVSAMTNLGVRGQAVVVAGAPAEAVLGAARSRDARAIVVGIESPAGEHESKLGATADQILFEARCSVMVVRLSRPNRFPIPGKVVTA